LLWLVVSDVSAGLQVLRRDGCDVMERGKMTRTLNGVVGIEVAVS